MKLREGIIGGCILLSSLSASTRALSTNSSTTVRRAMSSASSSLASSASSASASGIDEEYPGTAVARMLSIRERVKALDPVTDLSADWESKTRLEIIKAGGLKDLRSAVPGQGYTGHAFNDFNHCDLTTMVLDVKDNNNEGQVSGIAFNNRLGTGIAVASIGEPDIPSGGSWSTCMIGCAQEPPQDVAHLQFKSRIAFKLVWAPPALTSFVLVDDAGALLNSGKPSGTLPHLSERKRNYATVRGSKYAVEAERVGKQEENMECGTKDGDVPC